MVTRGRGERDLEIGLQTRRDQASTLRCRISHHLLRGAASRALPTKLIIVGNVIGKGEYLGDFARRHQPAGQQDGDYKQQARESHKKYQRFFVPSVIPRDGNCLQNNTVTGRFLSRPAVSVGTSYRGFPEATPNFIAEKRR